MRKLFVSMICVFVISASAPGAHALDLEGMLGAAVDAFKAVTLSDAEVRNMAAAAKKEMDSKNKLAPPTDAQAIRLARITRGISLDRGLRPDIKLYLAPDVNAFAMADGTIRVYSGLMKAMTDDEVCYVIGHEIGHVTLGHTKATIQTAYATSAIRRGIASSGNEIAATLSRSELAGFAEKLTHAQYSRAHELDADQYALQLMKRNNVNPGAAISALRRLEAMFGNESDIFASHPAPGDRAAALEKLQTAPVQELSRGL
ncbi:MAG: Metalloprotease LoiP precursor [Syntrophorhabdus sp. PtaB.Bin047]|nr:MAG: Metalloprotease LoiP precursor [Syntrophorhabdus sp. PtaB.Bin047]